MLLNTQDYLESVIQKGDFVRQNSEFVIHFNGFVIQLVIQNLHFVRQNSRFVIQKGIFVIQKEGLYAN